ncbi:transmembrane protein 40 [Rhinatrema bivittatum]|uniref:transmembrane protein 40 n=1 Tax=Rhinatrema bivittatum TaxID=194408 RepID=UPI001127A9F0|nr:transmembrane protein 40 [Rhinatrema bivittatum]
MDYSSFSLPALTQEQQDIFNKAFSEDTNYFEKISQPFLKSLVTLLKAVTPSILTEDESSTLLNKCSTPSEKQEAIERFMKEKGTGAILVFYLLLKLKDESGYKELPSSKEKDEKEKFIKEWQDKLPFLKGQNSEISGEHTEVNPPEDTHKAKTNVAAVKPMVHEKQRGNKEAQQDVTDGREKDHKKKKAESLPVGGTQGENIHHGTQGENIHRERRTGTVTTPDHETENPLPNRWPKKDWNMHKSDNFFHFLLFCFSVGAALVCFHIYTDWTVSVGIGLISFASLEVIGRYPGLVKRIYAVLEGLLSLWQRIPIPGIFRLKTS